MPANTRDAGQGVPLSAVDFHVLLVLAGGTLHGYAILKAVESESDGLVSPEVGSLYRVLAHDGRARRGNLRAGGGAARSIATL